MENEIEFINATHTYLINGIITPSVTQILKYKFPSKYEGIPENILKRASEFGTKVHHIIEMYERYNDKIDFDKEEMGIYEKLCFQQYLKLKKDNCFEVIDQEQIVNYEDKLAGKFDMVIVKDKKRCLVDIKCTSQLDEEYLSWQLGFYKMMYHEKISKCYVIWLKKKELGKFIEIKPKTKKECLKLLQEYIESKPRKKGLL